MAYSVAAVDSVAAEAVAVAAEQADSMVDSLLTQEAVAEAVAVAVMQADSMVDSLAELLVLVADATSPN